jgi:heme exporter protein C
MTSDSKHWAAGLAATAFVLFSWWWGLVMAPSEEHMGEVYRIIYLHVPTAFTAFTTSLVLAVTSIMGLVRRTDAWLLRSKAVAEVGLVFTILTLASGSVWGRPTWGTWWTWDARLTTTFLLGVLYAGWLILYSSLAPGPQRQKICAALGILIFADVPIIYQSVNWWRTLHQPQSIIRAGGSTMAPEMLGAIALGLIALLCFATWLTVERYVNLRLESDIERESYRQM